MHKWILSIVLLLTLTGCNVLQATGDPNQPLVIDPNVANIAETAGQAMTIIGTATGWAPLVGAGALLIAVVQKLGKRRRR